MTMTEPAPGPEPQVSLRERKKLATRRLLRRAALELVAEHGLANVTVEDIAEAAEVSPRTFFNYFTSKEAVLFGGEPDRAARLRDAHRDAARPASRRIDALRTVLAADAETLADELRSLGGDPARLAAADEDGAPRPAGARRARGADGDDRAGHRRRDSPPVSVPIRRPIPIRWCSPPPRSACSAPAWRSGAAPAARSSSASSSSRPSRDSRTACRKTAPSGGIQGNGATGQNVTDRRDR